MRSEPIIAPAGWGFRPGRRLDPPSPEDLPDIQGIATMKVRARNRAIVDAIRSVDGLAQVIKARNLIDRYGLENWEAWDILQRAKA